MSRQKPPVPRNKENDYSHEQATIRREFVNQHTPANLQHVGGYSLDTQSLPGNIENFMGVAQVPMGVAGPLLINGEHAQGEFYIPMATTEGTLLASYNRGMRVLSEAGGVTTTVLERFMQRSPVFSFDTARQARDFGEWLDAHLEDVKAVAESTTTVGKLSHIEHYAVGPLRYLRFNYTTGDAAGQNMVGKATYAACEWLSKNYPKTANYLLSGNIDTDKKHSQLNMLRSRGARVVAEAVIPAQLLKDIMRVSGEQLYLQRNISTTGALMVGSSNNGSHAANGLTALFIATGQDVANVAESHAGLSYGRLLPNGDYYWSITLPSLIIATYGGGTGLATQRECLEMLGCYGQDKVNKLAEIMAATVLAGELSLASAVVAGEWVESHDALGRNRP